jgi:hypothetical protein
MRQALDVTLKGEGELAANVEALVTAVEHLPSAADRKIIAKALRGKLRSRLRAVRAVICTGAPLGAPIADKLENFAKAHGAELVETELDEKLLAGFQLQLGDDRTDATLLKNLQKF